MDFVNVNMLGQTMEVGDFVTFNPPKYKGLGYGRIVKCTPKGVTINNISSAEHCNRTNKEVIKINEQLIIAKEKYPENFI